MTTALHPPGPKHLHWGDVLAIRQDPIGFLMRVARDYGDIAHVKLGPWHFYMTLLYGQSPHFYILNHPDFVKEVLVTHHRNFVRSPGPVQRQSQKRIPRKSWLGSLLGEGVVTTDGDVYRRQRRLIQPAFDPQHLASYGAVITDCAVRTRERWKDGATLDIAHEMGELTLAIVGNTFFGADMDSEAREIVKAFATILELNDRITAPLAGVLQRFPLPITRRFQRALGRVNATTFRVSNQRQVSGKDSSDLLSILLHARDGEGGECAMTDVQLRDQIRTLLLAGHFGAANALTWTWYLLSQHPDVEAKLHTELDCVLAGRPPRVEDLEHLQYTEMVFAEALRLYPPIWVMYRRVLSDCEIGGYFVPGNSFVFLSQYVMHHDPRYFSDPFRFDPLRWLPAAKAERPEFAYFPFGGGPRGCIGEGFVWMEGMLVIASLAQRWQMRLLPGHAVGIQPQASTTLRPKNGMRMILERRKPMPGPKSIG